MYIIQNEIINSVNNIVQLFHTIRIHQINLLSIYSKCVIIGQHLKDIK